MTRASAPVVAPRRSHSGGLPPSYLIVLSSSCQLYSGTGTALFDWIRYARDAFEFTILIDVYDAHNFGIAQRFSAENNVCLLPSAPLPQIGCPDWGVADVGLVLRSRRWDYIECVSWANTATNLEVLSHRPPGSILLFTPHTQPFETLIGSDRYQSVAPVFERMLRESDAIFVDSRGELESHTKCTDLKARTLHVPLGVNEEVFRYAPSVPRNQILCLGDFAEPRKRLDLVLAAFARCRQADSTLELAMAGNLSREVRVPRELAKGLRRYGYVALDELVTLYRESKVLLQLSDFEAFGLPIAEALCCGTPVVIPDQPTLRDVFRDLPGVWFVEQDAFEDVASAVSGIPIDPAERRDIAARAADRFSFARTYARKLDLVRNLRG